MRRALIGMTLLLTLGGCGGDHGVSTEPYAVRGVLIIVTVPGPCLVGGCDPVSSDATRLGLVAIVNKGTATAYLRACGISAALKEQEFVNEQWVFTEPAVLCAFPSTNIALAAGDTVRLNRFFAPGTRRLTLGVGALATLADEELDLSGSFKVR